MKHFVRSVQFKLVLLSFGMIGLMFFLNKVRPPVEPELAQTSERDQPAFQDILDSAGLSGCILIYRELDGTWHSNDFNVMHKGHLPASTFKIPHTLIGLDLEILHNEGIEFPWDGSPRRLQQWEADLSLKEAFHRSCLPCYRTLAPKVGEERMLQYLQEFEYGSMFFDQTDLDLFWVRGESRISPFEQVDFLRRFHEGKLPISTWAEREMKALMIMHQEAGVILRGKTGWSITDGEDNGWFVGYVESPKGTCFFATNVDPLPTFDMDDFYQARKRVTFQALNRMGISLDPEM